MARPLAKREKLMILLMVVVFCLILVLPLAQRFSKRYSQSQSDLEQARQWLELAQLNRETILEDRAAKEAYRELTNKQPGPRDLLAYLNTCVNEMDLQNRTVLENADRTNQPDTAIVRVSLTQINLEELVNLLHRIYSQNRLVTLSRMNHLRPARSGKGLECQFEFMTPRA
jgi:hypothetical protein